MTRLTLVVVAVAALVAGLFAWDGSAAEGQAALNAVIRGDVAMATSDATIDPEALQVEVIILSGGSVTGTKAAGYQDGAYEVQVDAGADITYIPRAVYQGVTYLAGAVTFEDGASEAIRDLTVYAATSDTPALEILETVLTVVALDRSTGELGFVREDLVRNPTDHVYVGHPDQRVTLRLPAPERTEDAAGENADGRFAFEGGVVTTTTPIRAGETAIVTRYLASYDFAEDEYTLRVTAPLATGRVEVRVPEAYVRGLRAQGEAEVGEPREIEVAGGEPVTFLVAEASGLGPGDGMVVVLDGFAPQVNRNVLTDAPQAVAAALAAFALVGGAVTYALRRHHGGEAA